MLYERVVEIDERVSVDGEVLVPLDEDAARARAAGACARRIDALAIVLMHGWRHRGTRRGWRRSRASSALRRCRSVTKSRR